MWGNGEWMSCVVEGHMVRCSRIRSLCCGPPAPVKRKRPVPCKGRIVNRSAVPPLFPASRGTHSGTRRIAGIPSALITVPLRLRLLAIGFEPEGVGAGTPGSIPLPRFHRSFSLPCWRDWTGSLRDRLARTRPDHRLCRMACCGHSRQAREKLSSLYDRGLRPPETPARSIPRGGDTPKPARYAGLRWIGWRGSETLRKRWLQCPAHYMEMGRKDID